MTSNVTGPSSAQADDSFELYDLRVEVVCPPGERIMCGAKDGDHFTVEGEMMYLPPGQGISIYSLGEWDAWKVMTGQTRLCWIQLIQGASIRPSPPSSKAARNTHERLDDLGRAHCLSRPELQISAEDSADAEEEVQPR